MKIAVEGCAHGELEKIYETIQNLEKQENVKVDLLICCGDFQSTRNLDDLQTMAVPKKFQDICTFYKYYSGEKIAPLLTLFIGGNHEASNYLQELPYGGWVAPNIYYLGLAGVVKVNGVRIAGISGIYKGHDYLLGHHEFSPYNNSTIRSVYHVRQLEVFRLKQLSDNVDICISHDWPRGVYNYGNNNQLIRFKPHFKEEIYNDKLGSPPCADILSTLQPLYWFAAHLHCKFAALIPHDNSNKITKFLALDKCLPKRRFLQIIDIETENTDDTGNLIFEYDLEWLTILFITNHLLSTKCSTTFMPGPNGKERYEFTPTDEEKQHILRKFNNDLIIPNNFCRTVESYNPNDIKTYPCQPKSQINPQTTQFCDTLCIDDPVSVAMILNGLELSHSSTLDSSDMNNSSSFCVESEEQQSSFNSTFESTPIKQKILTMNLPEPHSIQSDEIIVENSDNEILDKSKIDNPSQRIPKSCILDDSVKSVDVSNEEKMCDVSGNNSKPSVKKFKRRNQSIYGINDDNIE